MRKKAVWDGVVDQARVGRPPNSVEADAPMTEADWSELERAELLDGRPKRCETCAGWDTMDGVRGVCHEGPPTWRSSSQCAHVETAHKDWCLKWVTKERKGMAG